MVRKAASSRILGAHWAQFEGRPALCAAVSNAQPTRSGLTALLLATFACGGHVDGGGSSSARSADGGGSRSGSPETSDGDGDGGRRPRHSAASPCRGAASPR